MANYPKCPRCGALGPRGESWTYCACAPIQAVTQGIEAGTGETARLDGEATKARSAQADAPNDSWQNRAERAEAECKELRAKIRAMALTELARLDGELIYAALRTKGESNGQ